MGLAVVSAAESRLGFVRSQHAVHTLSFSAVVFCACETQLLSVVFCVGTAAHKIDFRLAKHLNKRRPVEIKSRSDTYSL